MNKSEISLDSTGVSRDQAGGRTPRKLLPAGDAVPVSPGDLTPQAGVTPAGGRAIGRGKVSPHALRNGSSKLGGQEPPRFCSVPATPEIRRRSMTSARLERNPFTRMRRWLVSRRASDERKSETLGRNFCRGQSTGTNWRAAARRRRLCLIVLVLLQTVIASWSLTKTFPYPWLNGLELGIVAIFAVLFSWISFGFWSSLFGFWMLWKGGSRFSIDASALGAETQHELRSRTAMLMPICNEDAERVFSGVEATYRSLEATGELAHFDFFILSDTGNAEQQVEEELAWAELCRKVQGFGKIFYRHRRNNIKRKSGNIADFLRRWGVNYDYMVVFDADSIMAGSTLVRLATIMDRCPQAGIVQTATATINRESLYARVQQFASRVYGPMLTAGLRFWQLGESYYWGHNAILRIEPFMRYCGLGRLPGKPPLGGEILSHDFVEAALMGRAGWDVWIVDDSSGSYEENPPSLLDELERDRRWCQGNLQHLKLIFGDGLRAGHVAIFVMGVMAYASALLWFVFLLLSTMGVVARSILPPVYFSSQPSLFPVWPQWRPEWAIGLVSTTAMLLFLPKFLAFLLVLKRREARLFGGLVPLCFSIFLETMASTLLAPVRMWFHSKFVVLTLLGRQIKWGAQQRADNQTGWFEALRAHGFASCFALLWIALVGYFNTSSLWWLLPVAVPLILAIPLSVCSSRVSLGRMLRRWRLLLIPEEIDPPEVVSDLQIAVNQRQSRKSELSGFKRAALDPFANAVHISLLRGRAPKTPKAKARSKELQKQALENGLTSLTGPDQAHLLRDAEAIADLHGKLSERPNPARSAAP